MSEIAKRDSATVEQRVAESTNLYAVLDRMAHDPNADVEKFAALMALQERSEARQAEAHFNQAMMACQSEIQPIWRNKKGENYRYADLEQVDLIVRPIMNKHNFSASFHSPKIDGKTVTLTCVMRHLSPGAQCGHKESYDLPGELDTAGPKGAATKTGIQGLGSTVSYLRRYLLAMIFNLAFKNEDDDGAGKGFIKPDQLKIVREFIMTAGADESKLLETYGVKALSELPMPNFDGVMKLLSAKYRSKLLADGFDEKDIQSAMNRAWGAK